MTLQNVQLLILILEVVVAVVIFSFIMFTDWAGHADRLSNNTRKGIEGQLKGRKKGYFSYQRIEEMLHAKGMYYAMEGALTPVTFILIKVALALLIGAVGYSLMGAITAAIGAIIGFFGIDFIIDISNEADNDEMLMDIKKVMDTIKIQTKGSVHLTNSLIECNRVVTNKRLKKELQKLSGYVLATNDMVGGIRNFNAQFDNAWIDSLCMALIQAQENGKSVQLLDDLSKQLADMQAVLNIKEQERINRKTQMFELLIFIGVIAFCVYALATNLMSSLMEF